MKTRVKSEYRRVYYLTDVKKKKKKIKPPKRNLNATQHAWNNLAS